MLSFSKAAFAILISMFLFFLSPVSANAAVYGEVRVKLKEKFDVSDCVDYVRKTDAGTVLQLNDDKTWAIYDLQTSYANLKAGRYSGSFKSRKFYLTAGSFREAFGLFLNTVTNKACDFSGYEAEKIKPLKYSLKLNKRGNDVKISSKGAYSGMDLDNGKKKYGRWSISGKGKYKNITQNRSASASAQNDAFTISNIQTDPAIYGMSLDGLIESSHDSGGFVAFTNNGFFIFISF